ncbi:MAG TPA: hypothetical protein VIJ34_00830 [Acidimicrobiales bacterium]
MDGCRRILDGYVRYRGDLPETRIFTLWTKDDVVRPTVNVYVPDYDLGEDSSLDTACFGSESVEGGVMVEYAEWEARVSPDGILRSI